MRIDLVSNLIETLADSLQFADTFRSWPFHLKMAKTNQIEFFKTNFWKKKKKNTTNWAFLEKLNDADRDTELKRSSTAVECWEFDLRRWFSIEILNSCGSFLIPFWGREKEP